MSRRSDYVASHGPGPFGGPYDDAPFVNLDRHYNSPRHRRSDPDNVPYNDRLPRSQSDNFLSERHDFGLRRDIPEDTILLIMGHLHFAAVAGSDPGRDNYGFEFEDMKNARYTAMGDGHSEYKKYGKKSNDLALGYSHRLKAIGPHPSRKQQREEYVGNPSMTRGHHREMYGLASSAANAASKHREARSQFDQDYRYHYQLPKHREGHLEKIDIERNRESAFRRKERSHQPWI